MAKIPARVYARRHKLSLFEVIRRINRGELQGESVEVDGRKTTYVLTPEEEEATTNDALARPTAQAQGHSIEPDADALIEELRLLRAEVARLSRQVERCCKQRGEAG